MKFYTADLHLGHKNVLGLSKRPFLNVYDMRETILNNWNKIVSNSDDVYVLGDIGFDFDDIIDFLMNANGNIHLLPGNHDKFYNRLKTSLQKPVYKKLSKRLMLHDDIHNIKDNGYHISLCHFPIYEWHQYHRGSVHLHGHTHGNIGESYKKNAYDVGVDVRSFKPVNLNDILINKKNVN